MRFKFLPLATVLALVSFDQQAQTVAREYEVKAAMLYNFTRFVEWPGEYGEFRICIVGRDPFGADIDVLANRLVKDKPIRIARQPANFRDCQMIFVPAGGALPLPAVGILVVAEDANALSRGATIVLSMEEERVSFDINQEAAARANLKFSYKLLRLARSMR